MRPGDLRSRSNLLRTVDGLDDLHLWIQPANPRGAHAERHGDDLRAVVDQHDQPLGFGERGFD